MSDLVKRLRGYQESWWETIQRLDMGESDNGIMTTIRFEQHDTFKKAADRIEQQAECIAQMSAECLGLREDCENVGNLWEKERAEQAERIRELEVRLSGKTGYCVQCEALAAQNQAYRETFAGIANSNWRKWEELASLEEFEAWTKRRANHMLSLPNLATPILAERDAKTLEEAAEVCGDRCISVSVELRRMAQEKRKEKS